ncbi:MAG TPA: metalloregulator ArsR/SmtB family transcription factor [Candidatus Limnocylindrales bacterium]|nr:metalloregulator ArsR/SmtB family transcription factor [Candidatus Limnocylindrales bacterium]
MAARTRTNAIARTRPVAAPAPVRDFTGAAPRFSVEWDARPAYDFLFSLAPDAGSTDDLPSEDRSWLQQARTDLEAQQPAAAAFVREGPAIHLGGFLVNHPDVRTSSEVVAALRDADPRDVIRSTMSEHLMGKPEVARLLDEALDGDPGAAGSLRATLEHDMHGGRLAFLDDPSAWLGGTVDILDHWVAPFAEIEGRVAAIQVRDVDRRAADRESLTGSDLIERTTGGVRMVPDPSVTRVILAPSYFSRPYNYLLAGEGWRFAGYPVADAALDLDPLSPPASVLRLHRALGDPTRLRILKLLADRDRYGTELAEILELSKPTITHHLTQLRVAGLVTAVESGSTIYYHLRRDRLDEGTGDLRAFLAN